MTEFTAAHRETLKDGDDPALGYCRVCGQLAVPPYPGYYRDSVCSRECFDEWKWREVLHIMKKPYRKREKVDD